MVSRASDRLIRYAPIRRKLSTVFFGITCIIIALFVVTVTFSVHSAVRTRGREDAISQLDLIGARCDLILGVVEDYSRIVSEHPYVRAVLQGRGAADSSALRNALPATLYTGDNVEALFIRNLHGTVVAVTPGVEIVDFPAADEALFHGYLRAFEKSMRFVWRGPVLAPYQRGKSRSTVIWLHKLIYDDRDEPLGSCDLFISESQIAEWYAGSALASAAEVFIINERGRIVSHLNKDRLFQDESGTRYFADLSTQGVARSGWVAAGDAGHAAAYRGLSTLGWTLVARVSGEATAYELIRLMVQVVATGGACLVVAYALIGKFSYLIARPIRALTDTVRFVGEGNLDTRAEVVGDDEIAMLAGEFNKMVLRTKALMRGLVRGQQRLRQYELAALHAQIKPHFLYNSLESVCALAEMERHEDVIAMVNSLARFYRGVFGEEGDACPLSEELSIVKSYLDIMAYRYGNLIEYAIRVPESMLSVGIPKFTLQPIVENAIYHGIKERGMKGLIVISGSLRDDVAEISVDDNGVGMSAEAVRDALRAGPSSARPRFGIAGTDERVRLLYGPDYGIRIDSEPGRGTHVSIRIPGSVVTEAAL